MKRTILVLLSMTWLMQANGQSVLATDYLRLSLGSDGAVTSLYDRTKGVEYRADGQPSPLMTIRSRGMVSNPSSMTLDTAAGRALIGFANGVAVTVGIIRKPTHIVLELLGVEPSGTVDLVQWGPYPTTISQTVGEIVGVVRNGRFAIGIQALNVKTPGGTPLNDECVEPSRGRAAERKEWGSVLQAYSIDRSRGRSITVWGENFPGMPVPDARRASRWKRSARSRSPKGFRIPRSTASGRRCRRSSAGRI
jgi:hypothetical protein